MGNKKHKSEPPWAPEDGRASRSWLGPRFFIVASLILLAAGSIVALSVSNPFLPSPDETDPAPQPVFAGTPAQPTTPVTASKPTPNIPNPQPWQYDPVTDQHWDPSPGHGHWHSGKPPGQPWQYDPDTNKHWNPLPGHEHWDDGPPPPPEQRQ